MTTYNYANIYLTQTDPRWSRYNLGLSNTTIYDYGCLLTVFTMLERMKRKSYDLNILDLQKEYVNTGYFYDSKDGSGANKLLGLKVMLNIDPDLKVYGGGFGITVPEYISLYNEVLTKPSAHVVAMVCRTGHKLVSGMHFVLGYVSGSHGIKFLDPLGGTGYLKSIEYNGENSRNEWERIRSAWVINI